MAAGEFLLAGEPSLLSGRLTPGGKMVALCEDSGRKTVFPWQTTLHLLYTSSWGLSRAGRQGQRLKD